MVFFQYPTVYPTASFKIGLIKESENFRAGNPLVECASCCQAPELFKQYRLFSDPGWFIEGNPHWQKGIKDKISSSPVLVPRMPFGKHKGLKIAEVPRDYLEWLSGTDLDEDLAYTVRHYLGGSKQVPEYDSGF